MLMASTLSPTTIAQLDTELRVINAQTKDIRVQHCIKRFLVWRKNGCSPHEIMQRYRLNSHDMYGIVLDAVQLQTGINRDDLLKFPGCGRGPHDTAIRETQLQEELSESRKLIALYRDMIEQTEVMLRIIDETIVRR